MLELINSVITHMYEMLSIPFDVHTLFATVDAHYLFNKQTTFPD